MSQIFLGHIDPATYVPPPPSADFLKIPVDLAAHVAYRKQVWDLCETDELYRDSIQDLCRRDALFWASTFAYVYEPRTRFDAAGNRLPKILPFVPWPNQIPVITAMDQLLGQRDMGVEKSRGEGMTWIAMFMVMHRWLYEDMCSIGLASKDEQSVDRPNDMGSLMPKLDWLLKQLPGWMTPSAKEMSRNRTDHVLFNRLNGSSVTGYSCTGEIASGARHNFFVVDEFAKFPRGFDEESLTSIQAVSDSRVFISTFYGSHGAYYRIMRDEESNMIKLPAVDWQGNPTRNRGMYRYERGSLIEIDPVGNPLPAGYDKHFKDFVLPKLLMRGYPVEGRIRSPWYDEECIDPGATPQKIAREYDHDPSGTEERPFSPNFAVTVDQTIQSPLWRGKFLVNSQNSDKYSFMRDETGPLRIWCELENHAIVPACNLKLDEQVNEKCRPPYSVYAVGVDPSHGVGAHPSVICVFDAISGHQVAEFHSNHYKPSDLARVAVALCKWFHDAELSWETNGACGRSFGDAVNEEGYGNVYRRTVNNLDGSGRGTRVGFHNSDGRNLNALEQLDTAVCYKTCKIRSAEFRREIEDYSLEENRLVHRRVNSADKNHGDRVMAAAIAWLVAVGAGAGTESIKEKVEPNMNSVSWRLSQIEQHMALASQGSDFNF